MPLIDSLALKTSNITSATVNVSVGVASAQILAADVNRVAILLSNNSPNVIVIRPFSAASLTFGIEIQPDSPPVLLRFQEIGTNMHNNWNAIASGAASPLTILTTSLTGTG